VLFFLSKACLSKCYDHFCEKDNYCWHYKLLSCKFGLFLYINLSYLASEVQQLRLLQHCVSIFFFPISIITDCKKIICTTMLWIFSSPSGMQLTLKPCLLYFCGIGLLLILPNCYHDLGLPCLQIKKLYFMLGCSFM
jgi:hypothetical protein